MIKFVVVDMDGTFLDDNKQKSPEYERVIRELLNKGVKFGVASGRQMASIKKEFLTLKDDIVFIAENGTLVEYEGEIIREECMTAQVRDMILDKVEKLEDKKTIYCTKNCTYVDDLSPESMENIRKYLPAYEYIDSFRNLDLLPLKISVYSPNGHDKDIEEISELVSDWAKACTSGNEWLDIIPKGANKATGIKAVAEKMGISMDEIMAFGDEMNDFEMMTSVYYSYAMDNAADEIKQVARFTAPSNNEYGVIQVIKERFNID